MRPHFCARLNIYTDGRIYFKIDHSMDTGNTISRVSGDYLVRLVPRGEDHYSGRNEFINLTLDVTSDGDVVVGVTECIQNFWIRGIVDNEQNSAVFNGQNYLFRRKSDEPLPAPDGGITDLERQVRDIGINYGPYRVTGR